MRKVIFYIAICKHDDTFEQLHNRPPGRTRSCEFLFYSVAAKNVNSNQSGGCMKTGDDQDYAESTWNTRNRLKMRGERRRGSSMLVTGVGEACFPARSFSAFARDEAAVGDHALFPSSTAENIDVRDIQSCLCDANSTIYYFVIAIVKTTIISYRYIF